LSKAVGHIVQLSFLFCQVHDYLIQSPAGTQIRESLQLFTRAAAQYELLKAEKLQMVNLRPSIPVEVHLVRGAAQLARFLSAPVKTEQNPWTEDGGHRFSISACRLNFLTGACLILTR
jgi:hypothetical protein